MKKQITYSNFVKWANKLSPHKRFDYCDNHKCVFASFLLSLGYKKVFVLQSKYNLTGDFEFDDLFPIPFEILAVVNLTRIYDRISKKHILKAIKERERRNHL